MGSLTYKKMSLFDSPDGVILVHSCNAQGVWGSGIAREFKERFPESFKQYNEYCTSRESGSKIILGTGMYCRRENSKYVGCLITSCNYDKNVDTPDEILVNTTLALYNLMDKYPFQVFYSNKFNSGLFNVPWEETEKILKVMVNKFDVEWIVCDPNLEE